MKKSILLISIFATHLLNAQSSTMQLLTMPSTGRIQYPELFNEKFYFTQLEPNGSFIDAVWDGTTITSFGSALQVGGNTTTGFSGRFFANTLTGIQYYMRNSQIYSFDGNNMALVANQPSVIYQNSFFISNEIHRQGKNYSEPSVIIFGTVSGFIKFYEFNGTTFTDKTPVNDVIQVNTHFDRYSVSQPKVAIVKRANSGNPTHSLIAFKTNGSINTDLNLPDLNKNSSYFNHVGLIANKFYFQYPATVSGLTNDINKTVSYDITTNQITTVLDNYFYGSTHFDNEILGSYQVGTLTSSVFFNGTTVIGIGQKIIGVDYAIYLGKLNNKHYLSAGLDANGQSTFRIYEYNNGVCTLVTTSGLTIGRSLEAPYLEDVGTEAQLRKELKTGILPLYSDDNNQLMLHYFNGNSFTNVSINGFEDMDSGSKTDNGYMFLEGRSIARSQSEFVFVRDENNIEFLHQDPSFRFDESDVYKSTGNKYIVGFRTTLSGTNYVHYLLTPPIVSSTGINSESINEAEVNIFPNPSENGVFKLNFDASYEVINAQGVVFLTQSGSLIDISMFNSGLYFVRINTKKGMITKKITF